MKATTECVTVTCLAISAAYMSGLVVVRTMPREHGGKHGEVNGVRGGDENDRTLRSYNGGVASRVTNLILMEYHIRDACDDGEAEAYSICPFLNVAMVFGMIKFLKFDL